jgi:hypothetical protein
MKATTVVSVTDAEEMGMLKDLVPLGSWLALGATVPHWYKQYVWTSTEELMETSCKGEASSLGLIGGALNTDAGGPCRNMPAGLPCTS